MSISHLNQAFRRLELEKYCALAISLALFVGCCIRKEDPTPMANQPLPPALHEEMLRRHPLYRQAVEGQLIHYKTASGQFLERVKAKHTAKELQELGLRILEGYEASSQPVDLPEDQIPTILQSLDPPLSPFVTVFPKSHVRIDWGGGWGHWGLFIGRKDFRPSNPDLYFLEWIPGIFVYHTNK